MEPLTPVFLAPHEGVSLPEATSDTLGSFKVQQIGEYSILPFLSATPAEVATSRVNTLLLSQLEIANMTRVSDFEFSSGFITAEQLTILKQAGICSIICLLPDDEVDKNEASKAMELGLNYHQLPISGVKDINFENAEKLEWILQQVKDQPFWIHCKTANRNGSLISLVAYKYNGKDMEQAITLGKFWGPIRQNFEDKLKLLMQK